MYAHEFALLVFIALPVLAIVAINVFLWSNGERGSLPSVAGPEAIRSMLEAAEEPMPVGYDASPAPMAAEPSSIAEPANEVRVREAA